MMKKQHVRNLHELQLHCENWEETILPCFPGSVIATLVI